MPPVRRAPRSRCRTGRTARTPGRPKWTSGRAGRERRRRRCEYRGPAAPPTGRRARRARRNGRRAPEEARRVGPERQETLAGHGGARTGPLSGGDREQPDAPGPQGVQVAAAEHVHHVGPAEQFDAGVPPGSEAGVVHGRPHPVRDLRGLVRGRVTAQPPQGVGEPKPGMQVAEQELRGPRRMRIEPDVGLGFAASQVAQPRRGDQFVAEVGEAARSDQVAKAPRPRRRRRNGGSEPADAAARCHGATLIWVFNA